MKTLNEKYLLMIAKRNKKMVAMRQNGKTLEFIGKKFGITKQRVKEILEKIVIKL